MTRVLVVDDDETVGRAVLRVLGAAGFEVDTCSTRREAEGRLAEHDHDLVVLDRVFPDGDNFFLPPADRPSSSLTQL